MARTKREGRWVKVEAWRGGRAWEDPDGRRTFYIRRTIRGIAYDINTGCTSVMAAAPHLERFEKDPEGYKAACASTAPLNLDDARVTDFLAWSLNVERNTKAWVSKQRRALAWWAERLQGIDLRRVSLRDHIMPALQKATDRATKIRVLKTLYSWMRKQTHVISAAEDPTLDTLSAPTAKPAQLDKSKVIPREHYLLVRDALTSPWREALIVQAGTGWHTTEVVRFAASGAIEPLHRSMKVDNGAVGVLVCPMHKSGDTHRTAVTQEVLDAAERLKEHVTKMAGERKGNIVAAVTAKATERGEAVAKGYKPPASFSAEWYQRAVKAACRTVKRPGGKSGVPTFNPGQFRHSVATWAIEAGADPAAVAAFLGHKSPSTTMKFYATHATPTKVPTLA
jgi:hypothetical protein